MLSCETCEVLQYKIFKENCRSTAFDFYILDVSLFLSALNQLSNCLGLPETAVHKRFKVFALEMFKDNQNIYKVESNILSIFQMKSTQQRKWMAFSRSRHHPIMFSKKNVLKY